MLKVVFRVYVTRRCRVCKKIHTMPTNRYLDHYDEVDDPMDAIGRGHTLISDLLEKENSRAEAHDWRNSKAGKGKTRTNLRQRPLYQWHFEVT
jgi:hypothetical protein